MASVGHSVEKLQFRLLCDVSLKKKKRLYQQQKEVNADQSQFIR